MGDPMFRISERTALSESKITDNSRQLEDQLTKLIHNMASSAAKNGAGEYIPEKMLIRRNSSWLSSLSAIEYISKYGRPFHAKYMLSHEGYTIFDSTKISMTTRLNSDVGLSYQELSYQILQAIDFSHLYQTDSVNTQVPTSVYVHSLIFSLAVMTSGEIFVLVCILRADCSPRNNFWA